MNSASHAFDICVAMHRPDGDRYAIIRNSESNVISVDFAAPQKLPAGTADLLSFLDEFEADPVIQDRLPAARVSVGEFFNSMEGVTLRSLRLGRGLSQKQLSEVIGSSQAAVSEMENRTRKPGEETIRQLARALDVDFNTLMEALANG